MSNKIEKMADVSPDTLDAINAAVKNLYVADVEAIRNLSNVATQLQAGGLTIPGDLTIKGKLNVDSDITTSTNINSVNLNVTGNFNMIPKGTIVAYNSDKAPDGWALCDGTNGTPDLRGRFIRMHSSSLGGFNEWGGKIIGGNITAYEKSIGGNSRDDPNTWMLNHKFGDRAGTDHHQLHVNEMPIHAHGFTDTHRVLDPNAYVHGIGCGNGGCTMADNNGGNPLPRLNELATANAGASWGHNNQPPYYVLSYIMKL